MAPQTTQFKYDFNKDKPLQKSNGLVYSKKVSFDQLAKFEAIVKFTIAHNDTSSYDNYLIFFIKSNPETGPHTFSVRLDHESENSDHLKLRIIIDDIRRSFVRVPKEFMEKELTLTACYVADTQEIKVSITDDSKKLFQVILTYDLALILKGLVEVGLCTSTSKVVVSCWVFCITKKVQFDSFIVEFKIAPNGITPYLGFFIDPVESNPATRGNLGSEGSHAFAVRFDHDSKTPDYLKLEIFNYDTKWSFVRVPKEFLEKELTLRAAYAADTQKIDVCITDRSKRFQVILTYDLALILKGLVEVGLCMSGNVDVSNWVIPNNVQ